jgi:hypothetical protein
MNIYLWLWFIANTIIVIANIYDHWFDAWGNPCTLYHDKLYGIAENAILLLAGVFVVIVTAVAMLLHPVRYKNKRWRD